MMSGYAVNTMKPINHGEMHRKAMAASRRAFG